jgi:hypothetical protein
MDCTCAINSPSPPLTHFSSTAYLARAPSQELGTVSNIYSSSITSQEMGLYLI